MANPASQKQYDFIKRLLGERSLSEDLLATVDGYRQAAVAGQMTTSDASTLIDLLLAQPKKGQEAQADGDPEPGVYVYAPEDRLYKVQEGKESGRRYAKVWSVQTNSWEYHGRKAPFSSLTEAMRITAEQAADFGHAVGMCVFCGRTLTDPRSVEVGYGPVCADYHSLPWGEGPAAAGKDDSAYVESLDTLTYPEPG